MKAFRLVQQAILLIFFTGSSAAQNWMTRIQQEIMRLHSSRGGEAIASLYAAGNSSQVGKLELAS